MLARLLILIPISLTLSCKSQPIPDGNQKTWYVLEGEPIFVRCLSNGSNITWFKSGSETEISRDTQERVHQENNLLKIIPARQEDEGFYSYVYSNERGCWNKSEKIDVFQYKNGLCYEHEALYDLGRDLEASFTIYCPDIKDYVDIKTAHFQWFKDCKPLDIPNTGKYTIADNALVINDATLQDNGKYTCQTSFTYNETDYKISRGLDFPVREIPLISIPVILYPTDNFLEAQLGTSLIINCKVLNHDSISMEWMYNNDFLDKYSDDNRVMEGDQYKTVTEEGRNVTCRNLTFSSVKEEDYDRKFECFISSAARAMASVTIKRPAPNYQGFLIAFFSTLVFLIIAAIIIFKVFKVDIVLWYRSTCFCYPHQNDGKTYDAYIMYPRKNTGISAYDMDLFVLKVLPEVLEQQCAYRLFIIGRDDIPGQAAADLVDETISQSRRIIIVLGNISKEDYGEDFEQKIAMYDALIRNKIKVILIELEKITDYTNMPESIKYIKQKQGVVRWKQEYTEASLSPNARFWKNVRYRMPPPIPHSDNELHSIHTEDTLKTIDSD